MKQILPVLADIANGIFATLLAGWITNTEIFWWHFLVGVPLAMMPDLDAVPELLRRGKVAASSDYVYDHREGLHYPAVLLLVGIVLAWLVGFFGWLFLIATMLHFVNDSYGVGWGVAWLWPFSRTRYKCADRKVNQPKRMLVADGVWEKLSVDERRVRFIVSWSEEELPRFIMRWGRGDWIDKWYLTRNWVSVTEYLLFMCSLFILVAFLLR
ncbi:metal-dependent hydrolase [Candidatus Kaiserbacteria bacterium]|nr:metal-dependent hydrolase [Candidatus Kaiserbacteria bacterium]